MTDEGLSNRAATAVSSILLRSYLRACATRSTRECTDRCESRRLMAYGCVTVPDALIGPVEVWMVIATCSSCTVMGVVEIVPPAPRRREAKE